MGEDRVVMERPIPTQEQIKEFWEWCGFSEHYAKNKNDLWRYSVYKETNYWWESPKGKRYIELPSVDDLNNLFKYAVPRLDYCAFNTSGNPRVYIGWARTTKSVCHCHSSKDPALALFWAIWEVIKKE